MKDKDKNKLSKNQIRLIRFCVCLAAFIVLYAVGKTVGMPWYVGLATYLVVYFAIGYDVLYRAARNIVHGQVFDENFLMCVATVGAFAIGEYPEAAAVMLFLSTWRTVSGLRRRKEQEIHCVSYGYPPRQGCNI